MSVYKKLMQARIALQSMQLTKSGENKFAGFKYFELGGFLPTVPNIFNDIGLCGIITFNKEFAELQIVDVDGGGTISICSPMAEAALKGCHPIQNLGAVARSTRRWPRCCRASCTGASMS